MMFAATATNVNRNPRTREAIRRRLAEEQKRQSQKAQKTVEQINDNRDLRPRIDQDQKAMLKRQLEHAEKQIALLEDYRKIVERPIQQSLFLNHQPPEAPVKPDNDKHDLKYIFNWVCILHGVTKYEMLSQRRARHICHARHAYAYWARELTGKSFPQIAKFIDRDHTTILHAVSVYQLEPAGKRTTKRKMIRKSKEGRSDWWKI